MIDPKTVTVGKFTYEVTKLPATQCTKWLLRLAKVFAPFLESLAAYKGNIMEADATVMLGGVAGVIEGLATNDPDGELLHELLSLTTVRYGKGEVMELTNPTGIDFHFGNKAPVDDMYLLAMEVIQANHFLPSLLTGEVAKAYAKHLLKITAS